MSANMPGHVGEELGRHLRAAGFRPLPDVDREGELTGTRLWRVRAEYVEYLDLRPNGFAHAVRARALFNFHRPAEHGPVLDHRRAYATNALDWLLSTSDLSDQPHPRRYTTYGRSSR